MTNYSEKYGIPPLPDARSIKNAGDWYAAKDREKSWWHDRWSEAIKAGAPAEERAWLYDRMIDAGDVGD